MSSEISKSAKGRRADPFKKIKHLKSPKNVEGKREKESRKGEEKEK
jgi:hypothetical protein